MNMLDLLAKARESSNVAYHNFLLFYRQGEPMVFGFVEGKEDPSFYRGFLSAVLPDGWECKLFQAGNKKKVLEIYEAMDWSRFPKEAVCFFVDRDLSDFLGGEIHQGSNLYVTDHYSVENYLVNIRTLERVMEEIQGITGLRPEEIGKLRELFTVNLNVFLDSMSCVMASVVLIRRCEGQGDNLIARLDKIKPHQFFKFTDGLLTLEDSFADVDKRTSHVYEATGAPPPRPEELIAAEDEFRSADGPAKFTRGKFLLRFFVDCVNSLREAMPVLFSRFPSAPGFSGRLGVGDAMRLVGPRAHCPPSLAQFIERNYLAHIKTRTSQADSALNLATPQ